MVQQFAEKHPAWSTLTEAQREISVMALAAATEVTIEFVKPMVHALNAIAAGEVPGVTFADDDLIQAFAQAALDEARAVTTR